jgi:hypothetical protein
MNKKCATIIATLSIIFPIFGQNIYVPSPKSQPDTAIYNRYLGLLRRSFFDDAVQENIVNKHNIYVCYNYLNAPMDTIMKYVYRAIDFDPIDECETACARTGYVYPSYMKQHPKEWKEVCRRCDSIFGLFNRSLMDSLKMMTENDQKYRKDVDLNAFMGDNSQKQAILDAENLILLEGIFKRFGYPGKRLVGTELSEVAFMIIQHSTLEKMELHLPLIEKAVATRQLNRYYLPYLIDRIKMAKKLPQLYGTQLIWNKKKEKLEVYPIEDAQNVDARRDKMGLSPLKDYLQKNHVDSVQKN